MRRPRTLQPRLMLAACLLVGTGAWAQEAAVPAPGGPERTAPDAALTLERTVALALLRNERAQAAGERAEAAQARLRRARSFFFPDVTATGSYLRRANQTVREVGGEEVVIQRRDALLGTASVRVPLFEARSIPLYRSARMQRDAARMEADEERRQLAFEAAEAFLSTLSLEQVHAAAEQRLALAQRSAHEAQARFEGKLVSKNDVTQARLEQASAERERVRAQGDVRAAYLELGYLLDTPILGPLAGGAGAEAGLDLPGLRARAQANVAQARETRPDVQALLLRARAADVAAGEPLLRLVPSLTLNGQYRVTNEGGLSGRNADGFLSLDLVWPLYDGGLRYADRDELRAGANLARLQARALERRVEVDVARALEALSASEAGLRVAELAALAARENAAETAELYRLGLTGALELAAANLNLFEAEVALVRERYGVQLASLDVRAALGEGPLETPR